MLEVNITELRSHLPEYLDTVQKGSEIWVTSRGKLIAKIIPPVDVKQEAMSKLKKLRGTL
jgi:prevent-host-death family protein